MKQNFFIWQYDWICGQLEKAGQQPQTEELIELIEAMESRKSLLEVEYQSLYSEKIHRPPPPPPWWW